MSTSKRTQSSNIEFLLANPQKFELLQAVRLIQHEESLGYEPISIKFRSSLSLAFPLAEIESMTLIPQVDSDKKYATSETQKVVELYPSLIGLTGPLSALPTLYTDYLSSRVIHSKDRAAPEFLDLFNHRLTELYIHASWFFNLPLQYELEHKKDKYLLSLRALAQQPKKLTNIDSLIAYAGMIVPGRVPAHKISHVLTNFLGIKVDVNQFIPEWFDLPSHEQTSLGSNNSELGISTFCGSRIVQFDTKIRIKLNQLAADQYLRLLPNGDMYQLIVDFIRKWCGIMHAVEMQLELDKKYIKELSLAESSFGGLGRGGFLLSKQASKNHDQTRFALPIQV